MPDQRRPDQVPVTFYLDRKVKADSMAEAHRRGETLSAALRRFLDKQYTKGKG
jgi:hypothetical protein